MGIFCSKFAGLYCGCFYISGRVAIYFISYLFIYLFIYLFNEYLDRINTSVTIVTAISVCPV